MTSSRRWRAPNSVSARAGIAIAGAAFLIVSGSAQQVPRVESVEMQPLAAQVARLMETLAYLGAPLDPDDSAALKRAIDDQDAPRSVKAFQDVLDRHVLVDVHINPESRVRATQGAAPAVLVQGGWRTFLIKVRNEAGVTTRLAARSPNARPVFARGQVPWSPDGFSIDPTPKQSLSDHEVRDRWLDLSLYEKPPHTSRLSGLELEYRVLQLYSRDAGKREATLAFDVGQGTQDVGFRGEAPILFTARPAVPLALNIVDHDGRPTTASLVIRDAQGHVYPSPAKRLAPDFAFHPQIYRRDGESLLLPAGDYTIEYSRGPEYLVKQHVVKHERPSTVRLALERWVYLAKRGWYSGDHHIHAAGCMHYEAPTIGVMPVDMIRHVIGEDLNVGAVLTWGPGYYFQKRFFQGRDDALSTADNLMRYDLEVSGFPSSHNGHLVLLRLKDQHYPGTNKIEDWPSWNLPILKWARAQGAVAGYAHSGWGLEVKSNELPNDEMPDFDSPFGGGIGANEYVVDVTHDAVDFISTVDTPPVWELNVWYHTLNAGFRTRISGESDFPCIYDDRVGVGRSYVCLGPKLTYDAWVEGVRNGRSYVSDGRSHLIDFKANDLAVGTRGSEVHLPAAGTIRITAAVAARLDERPDDGIRRRPATEMPYWHLERARIADSRDVPVEVVVNGVAVKRQKIAADGVVRELAFDIPIDRSSWVALRILPSSHTNPIFVLVGGAPVRASARSAEWCLRAIDMAWKANSPRIAASERPEAEKAYEHARQVYRRILAESGGAPERIRPGINP